MILDLAMIFFLLPKVQTTKEKLINYIKIKNFCASKDTIKRVKRQPIEQDKIFANHISGEELISRICKELKKKKKPSTTTKT